MSKTFEKDEVVFLGEILVDSGQILITDPCLIASSSKGCEKRSDDNMYTEISKASLSEYGFGQVLRGFSFASKTLYGDGYYPVWGFTNDDGKVAQIMIDLDPKLIED